jgi:hypothetical protein
MQSVFVCSVVLLLLLLMLPVLLCSCTLFLHLLFHCNNSSTAHFLPSLTRSNPPHTRALSRERAREKRQSNESETPTTHCWTIIPAIQVSSRFSSILQPYVSSFIHIFIHPSCLCLHFTLSFCGILPSESFIQIFIHPSAICLNVHGYFCRTLPSKNFLKFHPYFAYVSSLPSSFCRTLPTKFHPKIRPSFSCVTVLLRSLYWTMPSNFHPYCIHPWPLCL